MRWKRVEREIAALMGGVRIPLLGRKGSDLDVPYFLVEVKSRQSIGEYLWKDFFQQILEGKHTAGDERIPAIVLHRPRMKYSEALLCFRVGDLQTLIEAIRRDNETTE